MDYKELLTKNGIDFKKEINVFGYNKYELKNWKQERDVLQTKIENLGDNLTDKDLDKVCKLVKDFELLSLRINACYFSRLSHAEILEIYEASTNNMHKINQVLKKIDDRLERELV